MMKLFLAAAFLLPVAAAGAADLEPMTGLQKNFRSGASAVLYFTDEADGYHLVTTVQSSPDPDATVFRFSAVLSPGQTTEISVPHAAGDAPEAMVIRRIGNRLTVDEKVRVVSVD